MNQLPPELITESQFLLTELEYTLGQIHVQLGDLDPSTRNRNFGRKNSVNEILATMLEADRRYQKAYREYRVDASISGPETHIEEGDSGFVTVRRLTLSLLRSIGEPWNHSLLEIVKSHVADDRRNITEIAEIRRALFQFGTAGPDDDDPN